MGKAGWGILAFFIVGGGFALWSAVQPRQAPVAGHEMTPPKLSEIAQGDPIAQVSLPDELSGNAMIGKRAFDAACAACHGADAAGQNGVAPPLVHKIYEPSHHADMAFILAAKNGVRSHHWNFGNMPPVEGVSDGDVKMIAQYVRELQQANGIN